MKKKTHFILIFHGLTRSGHQCVYLSSFYVFFDKKKKKKPQLLHSNPILRCSSIFSQTRSFLSPEFLGHHGWCYRRDSCACFFNGAVGFLSPLYFVAAVRCYCCWLFLILFSLSFASVLLLSLGWCSDAAAAVIRQCHCWSLIGFECLLQGIT